jgi:hypothetical protein
MLLYFSLLMKFLRFCEPDCLLSYYSGNPRMSQLVRGKEIPEVVTLLIIVQNELVQKSGKNNMTIPCIDLLLVCDSK